MVSDDAACAAAPMAFDFNEPHSLGFSNQLTRQEQQPIHFKRYIFKELIMSTNRLRLKNKLV